MFIFRYFKKPAMHPCRTMRIGSHSLGRAEAHVEAGNVKPQSAYLSSRHQTQTRYAPYKRIIATSYTRPLRKSTSIGRHNSTNHLRAWTTRKSRSADETMAALRSLDQYITIATTATKNLPEETCLREQLERLTTTGKIRAICRELDAVVPDKDELAAKMEEHERMCHVLVEQEIAAETEQKAFEHLRARYKLHSGAAGAVNFANNFLAGRQKNADNDTLRKAQGAAAASDRLRTQQQHTEQAEFAERRAETERQAEALREQECLDRLRKQQEAEAQAREEREKQQRHSRRAQEARERERDAAGFRVIFEEYETKWALLKAPGPLPNDELCIGERFPWPFLNTDPSMLPTALDSLSPESIGAFIFHPAFNKVSPMTRRERVRSEILRWHPDKFSARVAPKIYEGHRAGVQEYAAKVATVMTSLLDGA